MSKYIVLGIVALLAIVMGIYYAKGRSPVKNALLGAFSGIAALFAAHYLLGFFGRGLETNYFTLAASAVTGIPGVITMAVMSFALKL